MKCAEPIFFPGIADCECCASWQRHTTPAGKAGQEEWAFSFAREMRYCLFRVESTNRQFIRMQPSFLVLASASPRRKRLLQQLGLVFDCIPSGADENIAIEVSPEEHVTILAERKARDVAFRISSGVVIGADTIVVHDEEIINKPVSEDDAVRILHRLSDQRHEVYTGYSLVQAPTLRTVTRYERTEVCFRKLDNSEILEYVRSGSPMDKAGAYGIQDDFGAVFVKGIVGDFYNVMGLPLSSFYCTYREFIRDGGQDDEV
jgi:septum formation protein